MELETGRLKLIPLTFAQLKLYLTSSQQLEQVLGFSVWSDKSDAARRAITIKLAKMTEVKADLHPWYTYWLIVVADESYGVGLAGFKGYPDAKGEAEIGYGLEPAYQNQGYTTEAVQALIAWAFTHEACSSIVAEAARSNMASNRVLEKVGMQRHHETDETVLWRIEK